MLRDFKVWITGLGVRGIILLLMTIAMLTACVLLILWYFATTYAHTADCDSSGKSGIECIMDQQ